MRAGEATADWDASDGRGVMTFSLLDHDRLADPELDPSVREYVLPDGGSGSVARTLAGI